MMDVPLAAAPLAYALLVIIPGLSLYGLLRDQDFIESGLFHVRSVQEQHEWHRFVTPAFLHADISHLLMNMLTFFFFAPTVEAMFGTGGFAVLFFGSQLGAQLFTYMRKKKEPEYRALGASGAVSGILFAFCAIAPMADIYIFFSLPIPAFMFALGYVAYSSFAMDGPGRVAHEAHLGGAVTGALLALLLGPLAG
ncbi:MAG: rhomboid family intramembrane serine protease [Pseudomonadota bacterium]